MLSVDYGNSRGRSVERSERVGDTTGPSVSPRLRELSPRLRKLSPSAPHRRPVASKSPQRERVLKPTKEEVEKVESYLVEQMKPLTDENMVHNDVVEYLKDNIELYYTQINLEQKRHVSPEKIYKIMDLSIEASIIATKKDDVKMKGVVIRNKLRFNKEKSLETETRIQDRIAKHYYVLKENTAKAKKRIQDMCRESGKDCDQFIDQQEIQYQIIRKILSFLYNNVDIVFTYNRTLEEYFSITDEQVDFLIHDYERRTKEYIQEKEEDLKYGYYYHASLSGGAAGGGGGGSDLALYIDGVAIQIMGNILYLFKELLLLPILPLRMMMMEGGKKRISKKGRRSRVSLKRKSKKGRRSRVSLKRKSKNRVKKRKSKSKKEN